MRKYEQIKESERWQIYALLLARKNQKTIAELLGRNPWTISREISKWTINGEYQPVYAQREHDRKRSEINKWRRKLLWDEETLWTIRHYLINEKWAPHSISGRKKVWVCSITIYAYIDEWEPSLKQHLKYKKGYKKRWVGKQWWKPWPFRRIDERPKQATGRERIWDFEVDTIHSSGSERKWWIVTATDRKTKYLLWWKAEKRTATNVWDVLVREFQKMKKEKLLTITSDNGKEFYDFHRVESVCEANRYFAHPYASYERPTNEQTNGMLRVFFPKWTDFSKVSEEDIQEAIKIINRKPRKSLGYLCSEEAFYGIKLNL